MFVGSSAQVLKCSDLAECLSGTYQHGGPLLYDKCWSTLASHVRMLTHKHVGTLYRGSVAVVLLSNSDTAVSGRIYAIRLRSRSHVDLVELLVPCHRPWMAYMCHIISRAGKDSRTSFSYLPCCALWDFGDVLAASIHFGHSDSRR